MELKTSEELLATTEAVIRDLGRWEYVYKTDEGTCVYRDGRGAPSCLIGHVLARWGVLGEVLAQPDPVGDLPANETTIHRLKEVPMTGEAVRVAQSIQSAQDEGRTWGRALEFGHETLWRERERAA